MKDTAELNESFGIDNELGFAEMNGEPIAWIRNDACAATIARMGARLLSWHPCGHDEVFWVSADRPRAPGQTVRGGVPICWPWFGPHPVDASAPNHGFVRTRRWTVVSASGTAQSTELTLKTETLPEDVAYWPHQAEVQLRIVASGTLRLELTTVNTGAEAFDLTQALHSYFRVSDIARVEVDGFQGLDYLDKVDDYARKRQSGMITVEERVDRIYLGHTGAAVIRDPVLGRAIVVRKAGSSSSVVWNPWQELAEQLGDMEPDGYRRMLCVETANAGDDAVRVEPGARHTLMAEIQVASG